MCARLGTRNSWPLLGANRQRDPDPSLRRSDAAPFAPDLGQPTIHKAIDVPVGMPRRRHLILQAMIKDLSKVTGAPLEVGNGPISIFPSYELGTRPKELIEIYAPLHRLSAIGDD